MSLKINPLLATLTLIGIFLLIFALIRGCNNSNKLQLSNINYKEEIKKLKEDSIKQIQEKAAYKDTMEFIDGQLSLSKNKEAALNENLENANERITKLLGKHIPIKPNPDTSVTLVPNVFINECADCFTELENGQEEVRKYKALKDNQEQIYLSKINGKDNRISFLEKTSAALGQTNSSLLNNIKTLQDKWMPRRKLYFTIGVISIDQYFPNGAGGGFIYQDKKSNLIGINYFLTAKGSVYQAQLSRPLSFKF